MCSEGQILPSSAIKPLQNKENGYGESVQIQVVEDSSNEGFRLRANILNV